MGSTTNSPPPIILILNRYDFYKKKYSTKSETVTTHYYPLLIKEVDLDVYAHVNNTTYLTYFEEARWDFITKNGYGFNKIKETGFGPVILEINIKYLKELRLRDQIIIETKPLTFEKKISKLSQKIIRGEDICCTAEFTIGLFDLKNRKLISPTTEWLQVFGRNGALPQTPTKGPAPL